MNILNPDLFKRVGVWYLLNNEEYLNFLNKRINKKTKEIERLRKERLEKNITEKPYWEYIQGHYNPYGKELYDYISKRPYIKLRHTKEGALQDMRELNYKMHTDPQNQDTPTLPCEKSNGLLLLELFLHHF